MNFNSTTFTGLNSQFMLIEIQYMRLNYVQNNIQILYLIDSQTILRNNQR